MDTHSGSSINTLQFKNKRKFDLKRNLGRNMFIFIGLLPALLWMYYFVAYPMVMAFIKSFYNWNLSSKTDAFIGLKNYQAMLADKVFITSFTNTILAVIYVVPATIILSLLIAALLNAVSDRTREIFTPLYFLPVITSAVAVSAVWKWLFHPGFGLINYLLQLVGLPSQKFLTSPVQALPSVSVVAIWGNIGYFAVILLAALKSIPNVYYEAAVIDGAKGLKVFRHITVPLLKPTLLFTSIMAIIGTFQIFVPIQIMTNGGPGNSTNVLALYIFSSALTGYIFAKYKFWGRDVLFMGILGGMMIPFQVIMIPLYCIMIDFKWVNTYYALTIPYFYNIFGIFLMRQFMLKLPNDLMESATIDGYSHFGIFFRIILPLVKSAIAALGIFLFMGTWNDYIWPLIVIDTELLRTLPLVLGSFIHQRGTRYDLLMAASLMATIPILIVFFTAQKHFIEGIALTGLKS